MIPSIKNTFHYTDILLKSLTSNSKYYTPGRILHVTNGMMPYIVLGIECILVTTKISILRKEKNNRASLLHNAQLFKAMLSLERMKL